MAKQIEDIVVRLGLEKFEGLDKIRSSFRDLSKVTNLSERDINAARTSLFEFAKAAGNTEAVNKGLASALQGLRTQVDTCGRAYAQLTQDLNRLNEVSRGSTDTLERQRQALLNSANAGRQNVDSLQRQIDSLKQLQRETRPGSSAFIQLGKDIDNVTVKLGKLKSEAQGFNLALNQPAGATPSVLNNQIALLQRGLQNVRYDAEKFVDTLRRIQLLQITQSGRTGRAGVIAAYEAFQSPTYMGGFADPSRLSAMPDTTAALNQELAELSERLLNTARGSSTYTDVAIRMAEVQRQLRTDVMGTSEAFRQLSIAEAGAERRAGKLADIQAYYATQGPLAPGVGGYRDPNTGAMIAAGAYTPGRIRVNEAAYTQPIGPQPFPEAAKQALQSVESAQRSVTDIYERAFVQRAELQAKYNQIYIDKALEGLELEGQLRKKEFDTQLADFDRRMGIADKRRGRRLSGMQLAQGVGAALSGGIFGGPEGLIGGLGGLAVGGVGGAFAGAAFGAQLAVLRQAGAAAATYAAEIRRLQLALQGIVTSFDDYKSALAAVDSTSRTFNVPVREATQQFTKLSAAVLGSGGTIKDAENTFKGLTASVLATGGSVEDINGALVAAAQVFSKGKVTAEELRGQIGERLAGAFALFAESSGRSSKGLDAALKSGEVTIADFVKFTEFSLAKYGRTAAIIANSPEQAGARLDRALKNLQKNIGDSLGPAGAAFQDFAARAINGIDKVILKLVELGAIKPGAGYYESLVLAKKMSIDQLETQLLQAGSRLQQAQQKNKGFGGFIQDLFTPFQSNVNEIFKAQKEVSTLEEALIRLRTIERETNKDRKARQTEEADALKEKLGTSFLQAFEQREQALSDARIQREEQIADIRKQSIEQARQLERQFADERRNLEREIATTKRGITDVEEDIARQRRLLAGEDPRLIEAEQRVADVYREAREKDIKAKEDYADREFNRARTIADFQKNVADQINKANEAYARQIGKIHREYATDVGKILDEASGKTAKRLSIAIKLMDAFRELDMLQSARFAVGLSPVPSADIQWQPGEVYGDTLKKIRDLERQLRQSRRSPSSTEDRFFTAYASTPEFENIAGLETLPLVKMLRQIGRPFTVLYNEIQSAAQSLYPYSRRQVKEMLAPDPDRATRIIRRAQSVERVRQTWDPAEVQWQERMNRWNPAPRSGPAVPSFTTFTGVVRSLSSDLFKRLNNSGAIYGILGDISDYASENMRAIIRQGVREQLGSGVSREELLRNAVGGNVNTGRANLRSLVKEIIDEYEAERPNSRYQIRSAPVFNERDIFDQPNVVPGVQKDFEGAYLPSKLVRDYGLIASASLQGILPRYTEGMVASRPWREGDFVGGGAVRPVPVTPAAQGAAAASDAAAAAAQLKAEKDLELELLRIRNDSLRPLSEQTTRLAEQNSLYKAQQDYIKSGITPALAEQYAQFDQLGELQRRIADSQTRKAVDEAQRQGATADRIAKLVEDHRQLNSAIDENVRNAKNLAAAYEAAQQAARFMQDSRIGLGFQEGAQAYVQSIGTMREATSQLAQTGIKGVEDAIFSLVTTGTANFQEFAKSILENTARMIIQQLILRSVMQIIGAIGGGGGSAVNPLSNFNAGVAQYAPLANAMGNAYAANGIVPFAMGGVVKRPTMFAFANGGAGRLGLMGEAGPEAIMPLRRLPSGRLGVEAAGGGNAVKVDNITINVENSGEQLSPAAQKQIAGQVRGIVLATLVDQRRGGGVLR